MKVTARTGSHSSRYPDRYPVLPTLVILVPAAFDLYSGLRNKAFPSPAQRRTTEMRKIRICVTCVETRDSPILFPVHVVRPQNGTPRLWDVPPSENGAA